MKEEYTDSKIIIWEGWVNVKVHICAYIMEEILHQLIGSLSHVYPVIICQVLYIPGGAVVQDFFHQQYQYHI